MMRALVIIPAMLLLGAATWAVIDDANLTGPHAFVVAFMAACTAAGAIAVARSSSWRVGLAIGLAVLCGEAFGMLATAERILGRREAAATAAAASNPAAKFALERLNEARLALKGHDTASRDAIAKPHCGKECRGLLDRTRATLVAERDAAERAVAAKAGTKSAPLADYLGLDPSRFDLLMAGLLTIGANGLACVLIAWGAHAPRKVIPDLPAPVAVPVAAEPVTDAGQPVVVTLKRRATGKDAAAFALKHIKPGDGTVPLKSVADAYWQWCEAEGLTKPDMAQTVAQIMGLFGKAGVQTEMTASREVVARGVTLAKG